MKKLRNNKIRKLLAFMVALALMVSCMPSAYTISASEAFGDGTEDIFTDGEITSEPAAEESTPDVSSADQEETEQAQQSTLTYENDSVKVTAEALEDGALPQNTALKADSVNENSSVSYDTVSQKLSAAATDKGSSLRGFFAYDVYFADGDGNRVEPNGRVRVTFEYKTPAAPELTDAASTSVTVEKLHYNSSTGDTDVNTLQANEDLKVLNVNEGKQIQTLQVETGNAAVFAVMWDSPETADVEAEAVSGNEDEVSIASEELTDGMDISDEPEQDAAETPAAENPEVTPDAEPSEAPAENPDAEPTEAPAEDPDVVEEPAEDIASPEEVPAADENGETSLIEVLGDDTNLRVSPSIEAEVLATVNAGTQFTLLDTVTAEDGATWYKVSWEGTEAYIRSDMAQVVDSSDEAEEPEDVLESEEVSYSQEVGNVVVTATAAKGVIPEGAQFVVTPIEKGSDQYADIEKQLHEGAENESYTVAGFLAYDISFLNDDGTKIEAQNGSVRVSIAYKEAEIPEDVAETDTAQENMNVSLVHFVEDANGNVTEVVNMSNDGQAEVSTTDNGEIESANFETESFSTFSVVWLADDFTSVQTTSSYGVEETVDSAKRGITINMFNYDTAGINEGHSLKFSNGSDGGNEDYNKYRGPSDLSLGIMQKRLGEDSYPIVDKGKKESSSYLFSTKEGTGKEFYSDANYLFKQDADGYYEYDSTKNFAQFNKNTKEFTVYKVPGSSKDPIDLQQGSKHGSFFPFNTLGDHKYWGIPQISEKSPDFHFGMTMSAKFIQPKDGKINGNNMVFEFSGDDDVWVYIDGVLVLDIGGIHNSVSGSIDFAEGTVKVGSNNYTLKNLFKEAGAEKEGDFVSRKDIFKDYTVHTINFYYLERGKGDSNCKLKFNLPTVPDGSVKVQKQLSNTDKEKYADVKFKFQLLVKDEKENYVPSTPNGILDDGRKVEFSEDKVFTLKPGQYATFSGLKANTKYRIKELGVSKNEYDKVFINDEVTTSQDGNVISNEATVGSRPWVIFTNKCSEKNSRKLCITKKIKGDIPVNDKFDFEIKLNGQKYTGNYYLQDSEGNYYTSENGPLKKAKNKTVCGSAVNGVVSSVPAGYTVVLEQILAGTSFEVNEINLNPTDYGNPEYSIEAAEDVNTTDKASGKIELGSDAKVTVTNTRNNVASLEITKVNTSNQSLPGAKFTLTLDGDSAKTYNVTSDENGLLKFENLSVGTYTLTETEAPSGYVKSTESYKVKVSVENNKATAKLYKADGTNEIENKQIINYTEKEEAENNLTSSKTAKVVDYENRIYKINLNAETTGREGDVEAQGASVVMVLDASDSMNDSIANTNTSIGDLFTVQPKEIVDVIDARFKLTDDGLNDLATNSRLGTGKIKTNNDGSKEIIWTDSTTGSVVGKVTIVERGDGTTKITWKEQAARIGNAATENENDKGWNASFRIQAKDDFIGGNMIPTNGADSGIYLDGGGIKKFEQPSVNVKLLSLSIGNDTTTVFKGDPINTRNYGNVLAETIAVVELNGSTKTLTAVNPQDNGKVKLPELTKDQISNLSTDKVLIIGDNPDNLPYKYTYPGSNEAVGYFTYTYTLAKGDNADNHVATAVGNEVEKYKLTVTYYPYSKSDRSTILSGTGVQQPDAEKGGTQVNSNLEATGNYVVNVVAGSIQIIKKLDVVAEQDETFNFTITDEKNRTVATATATIKKDEPTATAVFTLAEGIDAKLESDNTKLSELSRGDYKVVESLGADVHYELQEIATVDGTNCHSVIARDQQQKATDITFTMGTDTDNKVVLRDGNNDVTNGQIGIAKFTNKKIVVDIELEKVDSQTTDTKLSGAEFALYKVDTSGNEIQVNSYTSEQRGKISIKNLPIGQYVLRETKAPTGYVKSAEPWNITVANDRTITVKYDGKDVASKPDNNKTIYQITNTKVYSLPESGGPGTYGFTISGVAILATALLLFINNKRREEEAKRS